MKRLTGITILVIIIFMAGESTMAQNLKFGHINSDELIQALPSFDSAQVKLEKFRTELINYLELMYSEMNNKKDVYNKENKNLSDVVRQSKEMELNDMNTRIQKFQATAQTQLEEKQAELFNPISAKVDKAIKDVGKENGFLYIFDISPGAILLYYDELKSTDITTLVKAKLKIK